MRPAVILSHQAVVLAVLTAGAFQPSALAQTGWLPTSWFSSGDVDPQAMYPLAEKDGPWLVLATTFRGEGARDDARRLVQELRSTYRLQSYTHEKAFDYTGEQRGMGLNPDGTPKRMRYANEGQVIEVAVLVGDFASFEDPRGQKVLQKVKALRPKSSELSAKNRLESEFLQANRDHLRGGNAAAKPPLHAALLIPNPLLPADYFSRQQIDDFVMEMNADVTHGLLDCPGRYTVRVATFTGAGTFNTAAGNVEEEPSSGGLVDVTRFVEVLKGNGWKDPHVRGVQQESRLVEAADKAHRLTEALRKNGWPAWEFHDRDSSIVCVGSIDQLVVPGPGGRQNPHPEIARIVAGLGPDQAALARGQILPRSFDGIMLDVQPKPIDVPRPPAGRR
ncbi:MAG: hypothetical protein K8S94_12795 [Planctomycetia bacterium]|nr:hypothetical protein [Planctomycetia bacterium]